MAGTLVLTDTALAAFDDLFGDIFAKTDVVVQAENAFQVAAGGGGEGPERDPIPEEVLDRHPRAPRRERRRRERRWVRAGRSIRRRAT